MTVNDREQAPAQSVVPPNLVIRAACPSDDAGLNALSNLPGFRHGTLRLPYVRVAQTRGWLETLGPHDLALVALGDGVVLGSAGLERFTGRRVHAGRIGMGVHDDHQRRGIGTALLRALVEAADDWLGLTRLELTVFTDNERAIRLYTRFGFEPEGVQRCFAFRAGRYADALAMARLRL